MPRKGQLKIPRKAAAAADLYGRAYAACEQLYFSATPNERAKLVRWAQSLTRTNCGWTTFYVARIILNSHARAHQNASDQ